MKYRMYLGVGLSVLLAAQGVGARAQQASGGSTPSPKPAPKFEVASVKPNELGASSMLWAFRNGRLTIRYATLKLLIRNAYGKPEDTLAMSQVVGGAKWLDVDRFDIEATAPGTPDSPRGTFSAPVLAMLRTLLEERFALKTHVETKEVPLYALVLDRKDGTLGPGLRRRTAECTAAAVGVMPGTGGTCGGRLNPGIVSANGVTMGNLVSGLSQLAREMDRLIVDRTGLAGTYDVELRWAPVAPLATPNPGAVPGPPVDPNLPSLFTALQEQLGLRLERTNGPVEILVIDQVERPIPN